MAANFRAFIGAVSLKRIQRVLLLRVACQFPRLHRRGLIEARVSIPFGYPLDNFRAFIGAVSLKQALSRPLQRSMSRFPRLHRRGLIEAAQTQAGGLTLPPFPRLHRRGLIEALHCDSVSFRTRSISAPSSARSH